MTEVKSNRKADDYLTPEGDLDWDQVAPSGLCPFCDTQLPDAPSNTLKAKIIPLLKKSTPDPLPYNHYHRKLPFLEHASFCQLHCHERVEVAKAATEGWPLEVDFSALPRCIEDLHEELEMVMEDPEQSTFFTTSRDSFQAGTSGSMCTFDTFGKQGPA